GINDSQDRGFGVRVIAGGAWGFAASASVSPEEVVRVARRAVEIAKRGAKLRTEPIVQAAAPAQRAIWNAPVEKDAFAVPIDEKVATLLGANAAALAVSGVQFVSSYLFLVEEHKFYA